MADPLLVEFIELHARGIVDCTQQIEELSKSQDKATDAQVVLAKAMEDPRFKMSLRTLEQIRQRNGDIYKLEKMRADLAYRQNRITSGDLLRNMREQLSLERQLKSVQLQERRTELTAKYGRLGGGIAALAESKPMAMASGLATTAAGGIFGAAMAGFSGTVEMNRFQTELMLVSRELAGALRPAIEFVTNSLHKLRKWMEKITPAQQDALMYGTLGVLGLKGASMASHRMLGMGLGELAGAGIGGMTGAGGLNRGAITRGVAGGGITAVIAALLAGNLSPSAERDLFADRPDLKGKSPDELRKLADKFDQQTGTHPSIASGMMRNMLLPGSGFLSNQQFGNTFGRFGRGVADLTAWISDSAGLTKGMDSTYAAGKFRPLSASMRDKADEIEGKGRRQVTPADAGWEAVGTAYERIGKSLTLNDAGFESNDPVKQIYDLLDKRMPEKPANKPEPS